MLYIYVYIHSYAKLLEAMSFYHKLWVLGCSFSNFLLHRTSQVKCENVFKLEAINVRSPGSDRSCQIVAQFALLSTTCLTAPSLFWVCSNMGCTPNCNFI